MNDRPRAGRRPGPVSTPPVALRRLGRAAVAALVLAAAACSRAPAVAAMPERPPAPVKVAPAVAQAVPVYIDEIGRAVAKETVWVKSQVAGRVEAAQFRDGAELRKGDVLFTLDARPWQAKLDAAEATALRAEAALARAKTSSLRPQAALARARAALGLAKAEFSRLEGLVETKAVSRADYDAKKAAVEVAEAEVGQAEADVAQAEPDQRQAEAEVRQAQAEVARAKLDVEYCTVRSPIDGRAGRLLVDAGNLVSAEGDPLVMVERVDPIYIDFTVTENDLTEVQRNMAKGALRVEVRLPGGSGGSGRGGGGGTGGRGNDGGSDGNGGGADAHADADAAADADADVRAGELTFLDNAVQERTGTVTLRATLPNHDRRFWPGRFVKVRLVLDTIPAAVLVPAAAPQESATGTFVYVVGEDGTAAMRPVVLGQRHGDLVVAREGVKPGERIVVAGQLAVTPGGKVRVEEPAAAPAPAGATK